MEKELIVIPENNNFSEKDYQKLVYEESLKQTALLEKQISSAKRQNIIVSVLMLVVAIALIMLTVQLGGILEEANSAINEITSLTQQLNGILEETQLTELLNNANTLIADSGDALKEALEGIDEALGTVSQIDIETLNHAIADLKKVVEPLAKLFGR
ncbi:MAG: hypothetical protein IJO22_00635 [Oscillospiraceae bacterium]|nr:hypothetical protein [Oscillospiraceae bacterium]